MITGCIQLIKYIWWVLKFMVGILIFPFKCIYKLIKYIKTKNANKQAKQD